MASAITHPSALLHLSVHPADPALPGPRPAVLVLPGGGHREDTGHDGGEHGLAVDPGRIRVLGSSAGGHLAVLLLAGTVLSVEDPLPRPLRPDSAVLDHALDDLALLPGAAVAALLGDPVHLADERFPARCLDGAVRPVFVRASTRTARDCRTRSPGRRRWPRPGCRSSCTSTPGRARGEPGRRGPVRRPRRHPHPAHGALDGRLRAVHAGGRPAVTEQRARAWGREMREVHRRLREALVLAREAIEDGADVDPLESTPLLHCWGFCAALSSHHTGEDRVLFLHLVQQHPDLEPVVRQLRQDHSMIEHLIGGLRRALDGGASTEERLRHLDGVQALMESHFRFEERRLLDVLDRIDDDDPGVRELYGALAD